MFWLALVLVKMRLVLQLIIDNSWVFQKLIKYFNGTIISSFLVPLFSVLPILFCLNLNKALPGKSSIASALVKAGLSPSNSCCYVLLNYILPLLQEYL